MLSFIDDDIHHEKCKLFKTGKIESEIRFAERRLTWRIISRNDNDRESPAGFIVSSDMLAASDGWYVLSVKLVKLWSCDPARGRRRMIRGSESSYLLLERCCS
ncbi:hypothetical protein T10_1029 [Trichinella papuae]|uniref:Uncharacterized protein n=1 Tax=Trichinella papuae TaxID=268474 RepID=A0A0V1MK73_9BILA|nr:hypothetical protein T10_1029 [Trichinella papuae]